MEPVLALFLIVVAATLGGILSKTFKLPILVGYVISGILFGLILPENIKSISSLAQIGTILLLFSIGLELSIERLSKFFSVAFFGATIQIILVTAVSYFFLNSFGLMSSTSLILALGFSLSSTAVVVKMLSDVGELETIHGGLMLGWLLVQDLAVIPIMVILPVLGGQGGALPAVAVSLFKSLVALGIAVFLGMKVFPYLVHKVASVNSREILLLSSITLALGTALASSFLGISGALGAFLAGVVLSGSLERHAIFAETRPLRDLFVALFFVSLGFLVDPAVIIPMLPLIIVLALSILLIKILVVFAVTQAFGFRGRSSVTASFGLAQVGEFAFVIFSSALALHILSAQETSAGITVVLLTLVLSPFLFKFTLPFWRLIRNLTSGSPRLYKLFATGEKKDAAVESLENHIIICGYGRVGKWVGKALSEYKIPFIVVEYNQDVVVGLKNEGTEVMYGDPSEPEVMEGAGVRRAKAVILAIPDKFAQETLIAYIQTVAPQVKIISRVHRDEDWESLKALHVDKIIQPEFEAAVAIVRSVLTGMGKPKEEVAGVIKGLRLSHSK
jgi:monovalent cation:H+ antiporter-2, CPA2 family